MKTLFLLFSVLFSLSVSAENEFCQSTFKSYMQEDPESLELISSRMINGGIASYEESISVNLLISIVNKARELESKSLLDNPIVWCEDELVRAKSVHDVCLLRSEAAMAAYMMQFGESDDLELNQHLQRVVSGKVNQLDFYSWVESAFQITSEIGVSGVSVREMGNMVYTECIVGEEERNL